MTPLSKHPQQNKLALERGQGAATHFAPAAPSVFERKKETIRKKPRLKNASRILDGKLENPASYAPRFSKLASEIFGS